MGHLASGKQDIKVSEPYQYARVYSDSMGESHFADDEVTFELMDYAPPAPPISVSRGFGAGVVTFISSPAGWVGDFHPAPRRQFIFVLSGELEVEVSDGEARRFEPGSMILVEDTQGRGHISRVTSPGRGFAVAVPLAEE
jgi:quercetin dioxygenase-like cupin family protein